MAAARICLVTPGHLATNPRLVKEADALSAAGYQVSVVASRFIAWADAADREFDDRPWALRKTVFGPLAGRRRHLLQSLCRRLFALWHARTGRCAELAYHPVIPALTRAACATPADLYIAHNLAALPAAWRAARRHGARFAFDAEDFHQGELADTPANQARIAHVRQLEARYLPRCDQLTAASPGIARAYAEALGIAEPVVLRNVFPLAEAPAAPVPPAVPPSLYWFSQTLGPDRGLEVALAAIAQSASRPRLVLRGNVSDSYRAVLQAQAATLGVGELLDILPPAAPGDMVRLAAGHGAGLASEQSGTRNRDICLTNKVFTYLLAGLPVLATDTSAQRELAAEAGGAVLLYAQDDAATLAARIDELFATPAHLRAVRATAWRLGRERYNWDLEQQGLLALVRRTLGVVT